MIAGMCESIVVLWQSTRNDHQDSYLLIFFCDVCRKVYASKSDQCFHDLRISGAEPRLNAPTG